MRPPLTSVALATILALACATRALAQEFPTLPFNALGAASLLERGLPPVAPGMRFESSVTRWFGMSELATTAAALGGGWRSARWAVGAARTGALEVGWSTLAVAGGWADARSGAAVRAVLRGPSGSDGASWRGAEAGAGAWAMAGRGVRLWASAPQLWVDGEPPPLERRLELGARLVTGDVELWLLRATAPGAPGALRGEHAAGLTAHLGCLALWTRLRDAPARGGFGWGLTWRGFLISCEAETHPILGETLVMGLAAGSGAANGGGAR